MLAVTIFWILADVDEELFLCSRDCDPNPTLTYALITPERHMLFILTIN